MPQIIKQQPDNIFCFNLQAPYCNDIWDICNWDYYKNSSTNYQGMWNARTNVMKHCMDFTICNNPYIREEMKYFSYYLITVKKISLGTFAEYADRFKLLSSFVSDRDFMSISDIDLWEYEKYISKNHVLYEKNGTSIVGNEVISISKKNRLISFLNTMKQVILEKKEAELPLWDRDFWRGSLVKPNEYTMYNLNFREIVQPKMKQSAKDFLKIKCQNVVSSVASSYLLSIKVFCRWLFEYDDSIESFLQIDRDILEDYFSFLRVESDFSQHVINTNIMHLSVMFEWGMLTGDINFPDKPLFLTGDFTFKTKKMAQFFTKEEVKDIFSIINKIPKIYGRILLVLRDTGLRISEVLRMPIDCICDENGKHYIRIYQYKTDRYNSIPLSDYIYDIILREIKRTQQKHPNAKYVFVDESGNPVKRSCFTKSIRKALIEAEIKGRDGKPLDFKSHKFRATKATTLIEMGNDPRMVADMLGHKTLSSLKSYVNATHTALNEYMQEYLRKESILINSIGKVDERTIEEYENAIPLCNGWCCRPAGLGLCDKVNTCLSCSQFRPSMKHLTSYKLQLAEIESALVVARENDYARMVEKCEKDKAALEDIIGRLEALIDEKKHDGDGGV